MAATEQAAQAGRRRVQHVDPILVIQPAPLVMGALHQMAARRRFARNWRITANVVGR
jgi:hypothetical protein